MEKKLRKEHRLERLKSGNYAFGCPTFELHECDEFCQFPTVYELVKACLPFPITQFKMESRRS